MKKTLAVLAVILIGLYIVLSVLGSRGDYDAEHALWSIKRGFAAMSTHPESAPDAEVRQLISRFQSFIDTHPKSVFAGKAQMMLGNVYMMKKDYVRGRAELQKVPGVYAQDEELLAHAQSVIAKSYLVENNWPSALTVYKGIIKHYPLTPTGFSIPMFIAKYYESKGMKTKAIEAYEDAALFYLGVAQKHPKSIYEYHSLRMIAMCRIAQESWRVAVVAVRNLMLQFPSGPVLRESLYAVNAICITKLHDYDLAIDVYKQFMEKFPKHPVVPVMKRMVLNLQVLKTKGVEVTSKKQLGVIK